MVAGFITLDLSKALCVQARSLGRLSSTLEDHSPRRSGAKPQLYRVSGEDALQHALNETHLPYICLFLLGQSNGQCG